jgi:hypothetical protein
MGRQAEWQKNREAKLKKNRISHGGTETQKEIHKKTPFHGFNLKESLLVLICLFIGHAAF